MSNVHLDVCASCWKYTDTNLLGDAWEAGKKEGVSSPAVDSSIDGCLGVCDDRNNAVLSLGHAISVGTAANTIIFRHLNTPADVRAVQDYAAYIARNGCLGEIPSALADKVYAFMRDGKLVRHPFPNDDELPLNLERLSGLMHYYSR
ncbi:MAG: hypothetical protein Q7R76_06200 [Candidatus Woesearchaeota archaeon]|nr:hypothetical protein [Candidatus Woesearchaeota archaeon]